MMHHGGYILLAMWNVVSSNLEDTTGRRIYLAKRDSSGSSPGTWSLSLFRKMPLASFKHFPTITTSVSSVCTWRQSMHLGFGSSHCRSNPHSRVRIQAVGDTCPGRVAFFVSALPPQEDFVISIIDWWRLQVPLVHTPDEAKSTTETSSLAPGHVPQRFGP